MLSAGSLIVDSQDLLRRQFAAALEDAGGFGPSYEADSVPKARAMLDGFKQRSSLHGEGTAVAPPALVILNQDRCGGPWTELLEPFAGGPAAPKFFILSDRCEPAAARRALRAGADGYGSSQIAPATLVLGLRLLLRGECFVESTVLRGILAESDHRSAQGEFAKARVAALTDRERQAFGILAAGGTTKEVASSLGIGRRSAENYQAAIYRKLGISSPAAMALLGIQSGIVDP